VKAAQLFIDKRRNVAAKILPACLALVSIVALSAGAQNSRMSPYQGERDGINAGGNWYAFRSENEMTAAKSVRFELQANNYLSWSREKPRVELVCTKHKYSNADFTTGAPLGPPNRPGFWGQPQIEVMVRADDGHHHNGWNWVNGRALSMDKGTVRELIGARIFKVQLPGPRGPEIVDFSPAGLDLAQVRQACDLTPKKPSKD
jgi:hypothetical protein